MFKIVFKFVKHIAHKLMFKHIDKCALCLTRALKKKEKLTQNKK